MKLSTFDFNDAPVRALLDEAGEPWFVAADVCRVLELGNTTEALRPIDEDDLSITEVIDSLGRTQQANTISEAGLYQLVFASRKPEAKAFKRWVTKEVLPAIRKTGRFAMATGSADSDPDVVGELESNAFAAASARDRVLDGSISPEAAQLSSSLCAQVVRSWELRLRIKPVSLPRELAHLAPGAEIGEVLQSFAATLEEDDSLSVGELHAFARARDLLRGPLDASRAIALGKQLQQWIGRPLVDARSRTFFLRRTRASEGVRYFVEFNAATPTTP